MPNIEISVFSLVNQTTSSAALDVLHCVLVMKYISSAVEGVNETIDIVSMMRLISLYLQASLGLLLLSG